MATGDTADFAARVRAVLPRGWFPDTTPNLDAVLNGCGYAWSYCYGMVAFTKAQARRLTASGVFLDMLSADFFGSFLLRRAGELDSTYNARIGREMFREKGTRAGVIRALTDLTGRAPAIFEPAYPLDTGGCGWLGMTVGTGLACGGVGVPGAGGAGSLALPFQFFVTAYRPTGGGIPYVMGAYLGSGWAGGGVGSISDFGAGAGAFEAASLSMSLGRIDDEDIRTTLLNVKPAATLPWYRITN